MGRKSQQEPEPFSVYQDGMKTMGTEFRAAREARKDSLHKIASALGIDRSLLSRYERGIHAVPDELVQPWAALLDLEVELVIRASTSPDSPHRPLIDRLCATIARLPASDIRLLEEIVNRFAEGRAAEPD